jgi:hypothetical protein
VAGADSFVSPLPKRSYPRILALLTLVPRQQYGPQSADVPRGPFLFE